MKSNYDEILRDSFSEKIEVPEEYQQKMKETLKQACIASSQKKQSPVNKYFRADSRIESFFHSHKISVKTCLSLTGIVCACLGLILVLSILRKQDSPKGNFDNTRKQYVEISATPAVTENTVITDNILRTEIPADTMSPRKTNLPLDTTSPNLTVVNTHIPKQEQKQETKTTQAKTTAKPKRNKTTHAPEIAQVTTSFTPETIESPESTTTPTSNNTPQLTGSPTVTPDPDITLPASSTIAPVETSVQATAMPTAT